MEISYQHHHYYIYSSNPSHNNNNNKNKSEKMDAESDYGNHTAAATSSGSGSGSSVYVAEPFDSVRLPETLASGIRKFLRVANMIELQEPRISYLCRFHAFEIAHNMDRNSSEIGVRQFKTSLLQRLEQDEEPTFRKRKEKSDIRELRRVYHEYKEYITKHKATCYIENREMINARAIASVLFEMLIPVSKTAGAQAAGREIL